MSPVRAKLDSMIDCLPDAELTLLLEIVQRFIPDDVATPDDLEAINTARKEYAAGQTIPHDAINWN